MKFRLTYDGPLYAESKRSAETRLLRATHKHEIRKKFHLQLKRLWELTPVLATTQPVENRTTYGTTRAEFTAARYERNGYRFVPLVTPELALSCAVHILFLRPASPGGAINSGDIDNRLKVIIDALRMPEHKQELGGYNVPGDGENPFYVLLANDNLMTHVSVETDRLLQPIGPVLDENAAHLIISVEVRPYHTSMDNLDFS